VKQVQHVVSGTADSAADKLTVKIDSHSAWANADAVAAQTEAAAHKAKAQLIEDEKAKTAADAAEAQAHTAASHDKHLEHDALRNEATGSAAGAVKATVGHLLNGVGAAAAKAAQDAARKVVKEQQAINAKTQHDQQEAIAQEQQVTKLLDRIKVNKAKLQDLWKKKDADKKAADDAANAFKGEVKRKVSRAKTDLQNMATQLKDDHETSLKVAAMQKELADVKDKVKQLNIKIAAKDDALKKAADDAAKEKSRKEEAKKKFDTKKSAAVAKMDGLVSDMEGTIKKTAVAKATPKADLQGVLNELNTKTQKNSLQITKRSTQIRNLNTRLDSAKTKETTAQSTKEHIDGVVTVAKQAYQKLNAGVAKLKKSVKKKVVTQTVNMVKPAGTKFTKGLTDNIQDTVSKSLAADSQSTLKHFSGSLEQHMEEPVAGITPEPVQSSEFSMPF